jgi:hypothetical protein
MHSCKRWIIGLSAGVCLVHTCDGQTDLLSLSSASGASGGSVSLNLSLASTAGNTPGALQWKVNYPSPQITGFSAVAGPAASAAGKSIVCAGNTCVLSGLNNLPVQNGVVAVLTFQLAGNASGNLAIQLSNIVGASPLGSSVSVSGTNGTINSTGVQVNLSGAYTKTGIVTDGTKFTSGGLEGGYAYSANLLGSIVTFQGSSFGLGTPNAPNIASSTTVTLPAGNYSKLAVLAAAIDGAQK